MSNAHREIDLSAFYGKPVDRLIDALIKVRDDLDNPLMAWVPGDKLKIVGECDNNEKQVERIRNRYFRKVIAHPDGTIVHDGDCNFFSGQICTCGLLHELQWLPDPNEVYNEFGRDMGDQERTFEKLRSIEKAQIEQIKAIFSKDSDLSIKDKLPYDAGLGPLNKR